MEEGVIDHRYGLRVNNNFANYHVPVHTDVPHIDVLFVNKPDPVINPMSSKGMDEIAMIGFPPAVANAVFIATRKESGISLSHRINLYNILLHFS